MNFDKKLSINLFLLRVSIFIVMFMWTLDKFINPEHSIRVFEHYYLVKGLSGQLVYIIGTIQMVIVIGFLLGLYKKWSYGIILLLHTISTLSAWKIYLDPWGPKNLLFFAAWPMLAAIITIYSLREKDTFLTIK